MMPLFARLWFGLAPYENGSCLGSDRTHAPICKKLQDF